MCVNELGFCERRRWNGFILIPGSGIIASSYDIDNIYYQSQTRRCILLYNPKPKPASVDSELVDETLAGSLIKCGGCTTRRHSEGSLRTGCGTMPLSTCAPMDRISSSERCRENHLASLITPDRTSLPITPTATAAPATACLLLNS